MNNIISMYCTKTEKREYKQAKYSSEFLNRIAAVYLWRGQEILRINDEADRKLKEIANKFDEERKNYEVINE